MFKGRKSSAAAEKIKGFFAGKNKDAHAGSEANAGAQAQPTVQTTPSTSDGATLKRRVSEPVGMAPAYTFISTMAGHGCPHPRCTPGFHDRWTPPTISADAPPRMSAFGSFAETQPVGLKWEFVFYGYSAEHFMEGICIRVPSYASLERMGLLGALETKSAVELHVQRGPPRLRRARLLRVPTCRVQLGMRARPVSLTWGRSIQVLVVNFSAFLLRLCPLLRRSPQSRARRLTHLCIHQHRRCRRWRCRGWRRCSRRGSRGF